MEAQYEARVQPYPAHGPVVGHGRALLHDNRMAQIADVGYVNNLIHDVFGQRPEQAADLVEPLLLRDGMEPAGSVLMEVHRLTRLPAK